MSLENRLDSDKVLALIGYGLLISGVFFGGVTALVALILAYVQRGQADPRIREHYGFQITVFWVGFVLFLVGGVALVWAIAVIGIEAAANAVHAEADFDFFAPSNPALVIGLFIVSGIALTAATLWSLIAPLVGLLRLATSPVMRDRAV